MEWEVFLFLLIHLICGFFVNLKIIFYYSNPDDAKYLYSFVGKIVSLIGLELPWIVFCLTPYDCYIGRNHNEVVSPRLLWHIVTVFNVFLICFAIPYSLEYYELDFDEEASNRPGYLRALKNSVLFFLLTMVLATTLYFSLRSSVTRTYFLPNDSNSSPITYHTTSVLCFMAILLTFVGWLMIFPFLGAGLVMLPSGLFYDFYNRPKQLSLNEYRNSMNELGKELVALRAVGEELQARYKKNKEAYYGISKIMENRRFNKDLNKFKQTIYLMEEEKNKIQKSFVEKGENPLISYGKLFLGVLCFILSMAWLIHLISCVILPSILTSQWEFGFLDSLLVIIAKANKCILELVVHSVIMGYLLACIMVGYFRFTMQAFFCSAIHPMKASETHLNSILFNVALVCLATGGLSGFSQKAFPRYTENTYSSFMFNQLLLDVKLIGFFFDYNIFIWLALVCFFIALITICIKPKESKAFNLEGLGKLREKITEKEEDERKKHYLDSKVENAVKVAQTSVSAFSYLEH